MPPGAKEPQSEGSDPRFRVRGPVDEDLHGVVAEPEPSRSREISETTEIGAETAADEHAGGEHIGPYVEWVPSDEDDPDAGSGRTDAAADGYLPGEGTGRPYRR